MTRGEHIKAEVKERVAELIEQAIEEVQHDPVPVPVAVVGLGYWGPNLARNFFALPSADLRYLVDLSEDLRARHAPNFPGVVMADDLEVVLTDPGIEAVVLASPVPTHHPLAKRVLEADKHCFVEKPLALSSAEARELRDLAADRDLRLMVGHLLEYHPGIEALKAMVDRGDFGRVLYIYGNRVNLGQVRADENALWSLGPHDISVLCYLTGERPVAVAAHGRSYLRPGVEDVVFGYLEFASGIIGHLQLSWLDPHKMRKITVVGADKMAVFDDMESDRKLTVYDKGPQFARPSYESYGEYVSLRFGDIHIPRISNAEPLRLECQHFLDAVREHRSPRSDGDDGVRVVEVLEALQQSMDEGGRRVELPS